jgi:hypothetical protein
MVTRIRILLTALGIAGLVALIGCKEKDVPYVVDTDEIQRYLDSTEVGRDLFRWDSLIIPANYTMPFTVAIYRDSVIGHNRTSQIFILDSMVDYGVPIGLKKTAPVIISDVFTVRTRKILGVDTTYIESDRRLTRRGSMIKLGSDAEPYVGWTLWTYAGRDTTTFLSVQTLMKKPGGTAFAVNQTTTRRISQIDTFSSGVTLILSTTSSSSDTVRQPTLLLSAAVDGGFMQRNMKKIDRKHYTDTLETPTDNPRIWNLIFIQTFNDNELFYTGGYCIPYRIPQ